MNHSTRAQGLLDALHTAVGYFGSCTTLTGVWDMLYDFMICNISLNSMGLFNMADTIWHAKVQQAEADRVAEAAQLKQALEHAQAEKNAAQTELRQERERNARLAPARSAVQGDKTKWCDPTTGQVARLPCGRTTKPWRTKESQPLVCHSLHSTSFYNCCAL